jgi:D-tyrosyl-tRNA(Tyr) deacylase
MRAVVQRVASASVTVAGETIGAIDGPGLCVLVGVTHTDDEHTAATLATRLWNLRILADEEGRMNRSAADLSAPLLVVSQFTLYGDTSKGRRPSWLAAAPGEVAEPLVDRVIAELRALGATVATGRFGADMLVDIKNDGPVTILLELGPTGAEGSAPSAASGAPGAPGAGY